jgi:hypothetical protein
MRRQAYLSVAVVVLGALGGCGSPPPAVDWRAEAVSVNYPEPFQRLYLRDVSVTECAAIDTRIPTGERYLLDRAVAKESLRGALAGLGIFKRVDLLASANERPNEDGIILDLALEDSALVHTGERTSGGFWLWLFTGFPGLCVHDQLYQVFYDARARVSDARTGETLVAWEPLEGPTREGYALSFRERTSGFTPWLCVWIIPPTVLGIDEVEVARQVLPASMRPTVSNLVRLFNQISFAPVNKFEILTRPCIGIRVDDASAPVRGGVADITIHATLAPDAKIVWAACGDIKVDYSKEPASSLEKPIEIVIPNVPVIPGEKLDVEVGIAGQMKPQRLCTLTATQGEGLKPERAHSPVESHRSMPDAVLERRTVLPENPSEKPAAEKPAAEKPVEKPAPGEDETPIIIKGKKKQ